MKLLDKILMSFSLALALLAVIFTVSSLNAEISAILLAVAFVIFLLDFIIGIWRY